MTLLTDVAVLVPSLLGSAVIGSIITAASQSAAVRRAGRQASRDQARALFTQITCAIAALEAEKAIFRERRDSRRANLLAAGQVLLEIGAGHEGGGLLRGMAAGVSALREWDAAEGARFTDRLQAAAAQANPALVSLSLLSPELQAPCAEVADALGAGLQARGRKDITQAQTDLSRAIGRLRGAVYAFTTPPRGLRLHRRRHAAAAVPRSSGEEGKRSPRRLPRGTASA